MPQEERARVPADIPVSEMEKLLSLALSRGGSFADLYFEHETTSSLLLEEGIIRTGSAGVTCGLGVRVVSGERTGYAYTDDLSWEAMARAAKTAAHIASDPRKVPPQAVSPAPVERRYGEQSLGGLALAERIALVERADRAARAFDPRVEKVVASLAEETRRLRIANSAGLLAEDVQPLFSMRVTAIASEKGLRREGSAGGGGRLGPEFFDDKPPEHFAREAARMAVTLLGAVEAPAGPMPVVLAPGWPGILLHEAVGHGLEADFNRKGTSRYTGQIGEKVASDICTVVDDATLLQSRGTINVDDEGNEPQKAVLIENGKLVGYMHDRMSARHFGIDATGNGRRESYACNAMPRMTNTILLAGESEPDEVLRSVKKGIYAKRFGGGQVDISNGDFVFSLTESYLIEDGKLTAPLKDVQLIGNGPDVLNKVSMLGTDVEVSDGIWTCGKDGQSVPVGVGCPTVKIDEITVGGTKLG
jgi:TldD protein